MDPGDRRSSGFTLIEMALVMAIAAFLLVAVLFLLIPLMKAFRITETNAKIEKIEKAIAVYALDNYRIPCPSLPSRAAANPPFGYEDGSGVNGDQIPAAGCPNGSEGVVPFRTLGLPEGMVRDAWGNYMTYAVSQAFVQNTAAGNPPNVHAQCRTPEWMYDAGYNQNSMNSGAGSLVLTIRNISPWKARFCCTGYVAAGAGDTDLTVQYYEDYTNVFQPALAFARNQGPEGYQPPDKRMQIYDPATGAVPKDSSGHDINGPTGEKPDPYYYYPQVPPPNVRATAIAYVIVSHGPNGYGAYLPDAGGARDNVAATAGTLEAENVNGDTTYADVTLRTEAANAQRFDDIVFWRTQDSILSSRGESCVVP